VKQVEREEYFAFFKGKPELECEMVDFVTTWLLDGEVVAKAEYIKPDHHTPMTTNYYISIGEVSHSGDGPKTGV